MLHAKYLFLMHLWDESFILKAEMTLVKDVKREFYFNKAADQLLNGVDVDAFLFVGLLTQERCMQ